MMIDAAADDDDNDVDVFTLSGNISGNCFHDDVLMMLALNETEH